MSRAIWPSDYYDPGLEPPEGDEPPEPCTVYRVETESLLHFVCETCVTKYDDDIWARIEEGTPTQFHVRTCDECGVPLD